jgi:hypothetical protein
MLAEPADEHVIIITWDQSVHCWGIVLRWWANDAANLYGKVIIGLLPV